MILIITTHHIISWAYRFGVQALAVFIGCLFACFFVNIHITSRHIVSSQVWKWRGQDQLWLQTSGKVHHLHGRTNGRTSKCKTLWTSWRTSNDEMYVFPNISIASFEQVLENSYLNSLKLMKENNLRTIAFPSISTGIYGFPHVNGSFNPASEWFSLYSVLVLYSLFLMLARIFLIRSLRATWLFEWSDTSWRGTKILWTGSGKEKKTFFSIFFSGYLLSLPKGGWGCIQAEGAYHVPSWNLRRLWTNVVQILEKILHIREAMINWSF